MFDWLKNLFKSTEQIEREAADKYFGDAGDNVVINEEHDDAKQLEGQGNTLVEDSAPISKEPEFTKGQTMSGGREKLQYLQGILEASQKGGMGSGNSEKFTAVTDALDEINEHMNSDHFSAKAENNFEIMGPMVDRYNRLIAACSEYIGRSSFTSAGKHRKAIVSQVLSLATQDVSGINIAMDQVGRADPASMASTSWNDILNKARAVEVDVDFSTAKVMGGAVNKVYQLKGENSSQKEKDGTYKQLEDTKFFKPMMKYDARKSVSYHAASALSQKRKVTKEQFDILITLWRDGFFMGTATRCSNPLVTDLFADFGECYETFKAIQTSFVGGSGGADLGEFNISNRNVATSRIAELLGVGDIVVKSELAEVTDKATGKKSQGILMDEAKGRDTQDLWKMHTIEEKQKDRLAQEKQYGDVNKNLMAPTFVKQMMQLGVLDFICGQGDRHYGNYKIQADEEGRALSVQGIDNDSAFGLNTTATGKWANNVVDLSGVNLLHPIDKTLADRIQSVSSSAIKFALRGLIADNCIDACIARLNVVKKGIQNASEDMIIDNDAGWGAQTQKRILDADRERVNHQKKGTVVDSFDYYYIDSFTQKDQLLNFGSRTKELLVEMFGDRKYEDLSPDEVNKFKAVHKVAKNKEDSYDVKNKSALSMFALGITRTYE